jgi:hypothetical protein
VKVRYRADGLTVDTAELIGAKQFDEVPDLVAGEAMCASCDHRWEAEVSICDGMPWLECPRCHYTAGWIPSEVSASGNEGIPF